MDIIKTVLTKVYINSEKKDGSKFVTKMGKPYKKIAIQTDSHGSTYLSDFIFRDDDIKLSWKAGDEVEIGIWQNGTYWNFKVPNKTDKLEEEFEKLKKRVDDLEKVKAHAEVGEEMPPAPTTEPEITTEDLPF